MHRKRIKCLLTLSLCATLTSQNAMLIANAEEVSKILKNDLRNEEVVYGEKATIEEVEITEELTKENIEATSYDSDIQVDPEQNKTYSIDGGLTRSASLDNLETVTLTNPENIRKINKEYRKIDKETDVLSFPMFEKQELDEMIAKKQFEHEDVLGDLVISIEKVKEQAKEYGHSFERELSYMVVHGFYHVMGYDHIKEEDKAKMRPKEEKVLNDLKITRE